MNPFQQKRPQSILGITLDGGRLEVALARRTNGSAEVKNTLSLPFPHDLLKDDPAKVGATLHNALADAGIRERYCVVGVPTEWVLALHHSLPDLPPDDLQSLLDLEAERGFPSSPDQLQLAASPHLAGANRYVTQLALLADHVQRLEAILAGAQLRPVRFSIAIAALPDAIAEKNNGCITAVVGDSRLALLLSAGGGIVALRTLDSVLDHESPEPRFSADAVARELRITLGQLPEDLRGLLQQIRITGSSPLADQLARDLGAKIAPLGLKLERLASAPAREHGLKITGNTHLSGAVSLAAQFLSNSPGTLNFLPPKPTIWQQFAQRYAGKRLAYASAAAAAVLALVLGLFLIQGLRLSSLRSNWKEMEQPVRELDDLQAQIRTFRPWYDPNPTSLGILLRVTEAFPEEGTVTAKTVEIRNQSTVNLSGTAANNSDLLHTLDQLRAAREVSDLKVNTIRGKAPLQFTFNFQWGTHP